MRRKKASGHTEMEIIELLERYFKQNFPEKVYFKPTMVDYNDEIVKFGMSKHYGILTVRIKELLII